MGEFAISLRNYAGVPVVDLIGRIDAGMQGALEEMMSKLVLAGHSNIMLNLKRVTIPNHISPMLQKIAKLCSDHYGKLDVIAETAQIAAIREAHEGSNDRLLQFSSTEREALMRMRGISNFAVEEERAMPARLA